jgi:hypothetical protein
MTVPDPSSSDAVSRDALIELAFMPQVHSTTILAAAIRIEQSELPWVRAAGARLRRLHLRVLSCEVQVS